MGDQPLASGRVRREKIPRRRFHPQRLILPMCVCQVLVKLREVHMIEPDPGGLLVEIADGPKVRMELMEYNGRAGGPSRVLFEGESQRRIALASRLRIHQGDKIPKNQEGQREPGYRAVDRLARTAEHRTTTSGAR